MRRLLVLSGLLMLGALGTWLSLRGGGEARPQPAVVAPADPVPSISAPGTNPGSAQVQVEVSASPDRTAVGEPRPHPELPQGFTGRVVDGTGLALRDATIDLLEAIARNPFDSIVIADRGVVVPPSARASSGIDGRFRIGAQNLSARSYALRVRAPGYAESVLGEVTLFPARWVDLGDIKLARGVSLSGRITVQGAEGFPVPDATVTARPVGLTPLIAPIADREDGVTVTCDAAGNYRFDALPAGMTQLTAVAPGFARVLRPTVDLRADIENTCDIELPRGVSIRGVVRAQDGRGLEGAVVDAVPLSNNPPQPRASARSDGDGHFEIIGLLEINYVVGAVAKDHVRGEVKPVHAPERAVELALMAQPQVFVSVVDPAERALPQYDLLLLRWRAENEGLSGVPGAQIARVLEVDLDSGVFALGGVDPGAYVLQVEAPGIAKSFSDPFEVTLGRTRVDVRVTVRRGANLRLQVLDPTRAPLAGAVVDSLPQFADDNPLLGMLADVIPLRTTQLRALSGADGRVELAHLAAGPYQLRVTHPDFCDLWVRDLVVSDEQSVALDPVLMQHGTLVTGTTTLDGRPTGQIKVILVAVDADGATVQPQILADAVSDDLGEFRLAKRLPAGRYLARARRETLPTPLLQVLDYEKTRRIVTLAPSQELLRLQFALQTN